MKFINEESGLIGGIMYMVICVGMAVILFLALSPVMDALCEMGRLNFVPPAGTSWERIALYNEEIIAMWYKVFIFMAINGILYGVMTPLKKMLYDKFGRKVDWGY